MFPRVFLMPKASPHISGLPVNSALFTGLLLTLILLSGCKIASTPTKVQADIEAQSQSTMPNEQQTRSQTVQTNAPPKADNTSAARSDEEMIGDIDGELDASIAVFDGMILEERTRAEAIEASLGGSGEQGGGSAGGSAGGDGSLFEDGDIYEGLPGYGEFPEDAEGDEAGENTTAGTSSDSDTTTEDGARQSSGPETTRRGGVPADIEGGSDDDIVARQIREAALKEKDPVLREKLWDEYRKYKNQ